MQMHDGEIETVFELIKEIMDDRLKPLPRRTIGFQVSVQLCKMPSFAPTPPIPVRIFCKISHLRRGSYSRNCCKPGRHYPYPGIAKPGMPT